MVGLLSSATLEYLHVRAYLDPAADSLCSIGPGFDCAAVAVSSYSVFLGLPWALWGVVGFLALLIASLRRSVWLLPLSVAAAVGSVCLLLTSAFWVRSICYLCEVTHAVSWLLLFFVVRSRRALLGQITARNAFLSLDGLTHVIAAPAGLALGLLVFLPHYWVTFTFRQQPPYPTGTTEDGLPWIGAKHPRVTLEEYIDYTCPHCRARSARTLSALSRHPELRLVRRQQPRMRCDESRPTSCNYARLALCAQDQGKFWQADRWLFENSDVRRPPKLEKMAHDLDLDVDGLVACFGGATTFHRARQEYRSAMRRGIRYVPGYVLDGKRLQISEVERLLE